MVEILLSFWDGLFSGAILVLGSVAPFDINILFTHKKDGKNGPFKNWAFKDHNFSHQLSPNSHQLGRFCLWATDCLENWNESIPVKYCLLRRNSTGFFWGYYDFHMGNGWATPIAPYSYPVLSIGSLDSKTWRMEDGWTSANSIHWKKWCKWLITMISNVP